MVQSEVRQLEEATTSVAERWYSTVVGGAAADVEALLAPDFVWRIAAHDRDRTQSVALFGALFEAFPDATLTVDELMVAGDRFACHWSVTGTQTGILRGHAPTGRRVSWCGTEIGHVRDGLLANLQGDLDQIGLDRQLGFIPGP